MTTEHVERDGATEQRWYRVPAEVVPADLRLLRFAPLDLATWAVAALVASTAIVVNELHKRLRSAGPSGSRAQGGPAGERMAAATTGDNGRRRHRRQTHVP